MVVLTGETSTRRHDYEENIKVIVKKNPNGDTRTASKDVTFEDFQKANRMHIEDVRNTMNKLSQILKQSGEVHDRTKLSDEELFYRDFKDTLENGSNFILGDWYQLHVTTEAHHPTSYCHKNIDLLDILEMMADCICAGKARTGTIRNLEINDEILKLAFNNTVEKIDKMVEVEE